MRKLTKILSSTLGEDRTAAEKRTDDYQAAEGMTEPASTRPAKDQPKKRSTKADSSVLMPTPAGGGGGCLLRLLDLAKLLGVAAVAVALLSGCEQGKTPPSPTTAWCIAQQGSCTTEAPTAVCEEDEPCWDCRTMGNGVCSPGERQR